MNTTQSPDSSNDGNFREHFGDAARYWEKRRLNYNLVLAAIVTAWFWFTWPHFQPALNFRDLSLLAVLGILANVCYSAAYLVDIPMQYSLPRDSWRRNRRILWLIGMALAVVFTNYWIADEIYPYVNQ